MPYQAGNITVMADEKLEAKRRVKIDTNNATADPPKVLYADAGEDAIGVTEYSVATGELVGLRPLNGEGTFEIECTIDSAINVGTVLYAAADGKVSDASSGSAVGVAFENASASNEHIEVVMWSLKSTTAATVSIADAGGFTSEATVEAALQEIYQHIASAQAFIPISLFDLREHSTMSVGASNTVMGALASDTTPILGPINGGTDGAQRVHWAAADVDPVMFQVALPPDLDVSANVVLHARVAQSDATDSGSMTVESWFNEGDTKVSDTLAANATTDYAEVTATIAAADVPTGAQVLTCSLTPAAHANDAIYLTGLWIEYTRKILTA